MCFRLHCCAGRKLRWSASSRCGCRCQQRRRRSLGREASRSQGASRDEQQESLWFQQLKQNGEKTVEKREGEREKNPCVFFTTHMCWMDRKR